MKRIFLLLSLLLTTSALAAPQPPRPPYPPGPPNPPPSQPDYLYRATNHYVGNEGMFDLRQIFNIGNQYYGRQIEFVTIKARSTAGMGQATLIVNGNRSGNTQYVDGASRDFFFMPDPRGGDHLDTEVRTLKVYLKGQMVLEAIGVKFAGNGHNPPPNPPMFAHGRVNMNIIGMGRVNVDEYVNLMRFRGYRLTGVILRSSSMQIPPIPGEVAFCTARACSPAIKLTPNSREQRFNMRTPEYVDGNSRAWRFETKGAVSVDSFTLMFSRR